MKKLFSRSFCSSRTLQLLDFTMFHSVIKVILVSFASSNLCRGLPSSRAPHLTIHLTYLAQLYWYCYASKLFKDPVPSCFVLKWKLGCIIVTIILSFPTYTLGGDQVPSCSEVLWLWKSFTTPALRFAPWLHLSSNLTRYYVALEAQLSKNMGPRAEYSDSVLNVGVGPGATPIKSRRTGRWPSL